MVRMIDHASGKKGRVARLGAIVAGAFLFIALLSPTVSAGGDHPPKAILKNNLGRQEGPTPTFSYGRRDSRRFCSDTIADGWAEWPTALEHKRHRKLHLRFRKDRKPTELEIREHRGWGVGYKLKPVLNGKGETVGWDARFRRPELGHHRLWVDVTWRGAHECHYDQATYMFHVKTIQ